VSLLNQLHQLRQLHRQIHRQVRDRLGDHLARPTNQALATLRPSGRSRLAAAALISLLTLVALDVALAAPARSASNLNVGYRIPDAAGRPGASWIGSYRVGGQTAYCADPLRDGPSTGGAYRPPVPASSFTSSTGRTASAAQIETAAYVLSRYGTTTSATQAAAVDAIVYYELFNLSGGVDYRFTTGRGGQRVVQTGNGGSVSSQIRAMLAAAAAYRGPYRVAVTATGAAQAGQNSIVRVQLVSAAGRAVPAARFTVSLSGASGSSWTIVANSSGVATLTIPSTAAGAHTVTAASVVADSRLSLMSPSTSKAQRVLVSGRTTTATGATAFTTTPKPGQPTISTVTSNTTLTAGTAVSDTVVVSDVVDGYTGTLVATLYGPFVARPTAASCAQRDAFGSVSLQVVRSGTFVTPSLKPTEPGYYVWVETLPAGAGQLAAITPCGLVPETTLVTPPTGTIQLHKGVRPSGADLAGAIYALTDCKGRRIAVLPATDSSGLAQVTAAAGHYCLVETTAPQGYLVDPAPQHVDVVARALVTVDARDNPVLQVLPRTGGTTGAGSTAPSGSDRMPPARVLPAAVTATLLAVGALFVAARRRRSA
jgi:Prealbumin-like fold domain